MYSVIECEFLSRLESIHIDLHILHVKPVVLLFAVMMEQSLVVPSIRK